jgi:hypothetical protein
MRINFQTLLSRALPLLIIPTLAVGCGGCGNGDHTANGTGNAADGQELHDGHGHDGHDHDGATAGRDGLDGASGVNTGVEGGDLDRTPLTPTEERTETVKNLQGLRAVLVAELEQVRERLKDGTRPAEEKKADTQRAAELAQGLERLDRTIKGIDEADDVTWGQVRESQLKAAAEFREWMAKYGLAS